MKTIHGSWRTWDDAVTLIDAHHHLWDLKRNHYPWLADEPEHHFFLGEYEALKRDYMPEDYLQIPHATTSCRRSIARLRWIASTK